MKRFLMTAAGVALAVSVHAVPTQTITIDVNDSGVVPSIEIMQATAPRLSVNLEQDGKPYRDLRGYTGKFYYGSSLTSSAFAVITTTNVDSSAGALVFDLSSADTNTNGTFGAYFIVLNATNRVFWYGEGTLDIRKTTITTGAGALVMTNATEQDPVALPRVQALETAVGNGSNVWNSATNAATYAALSATSSADRAASEIAATNIVSGATNALGSAASVNVGWVSNSIPLIGSLIDESTPFLIYTADVGMDGADEERMSTLLGLGTLSKSNSVLLTNIGNAGTAAASNSAAFVASAGGVGTNLTITIPDATLTNQPASFGQLQQYAASSDAFWFYGSSNAVVPGVLVATGFTNWANSTASTGIGVTQAVAMADGTGYVGAYMSARSFRSVAGGAGVAQIWAWRAGNPDTAQIKLEFYLYDTVAQTNVYEYEPSPAYQTLTTTPTLYTFTVPVTDYASVNPLRLSVRVKAITANTATIYLATEGNFLSHANLTLPASERSVAYATSAGFATNTTLAGVSGAGTAAALDSNRVVKVSAIDTNWPGKIHLTFRVPNVAGAGVAGATGTVGSVYAERAFPAGVYTNVSRASMLIHYTTNDNWAATAGALTNIGFRMYQSWSGGGNLASFSTITQTLPGVVTAVGDYVRHSIPMTNFWLNVPAPYAGVSPVQVVFQMFNTSWPATTVTNIGAIVILEMSRGP